MDVIELLVHALPQDFNGNKTESNITDHMAVSVSNSMP